MDSNIGPIRYGLIRINMESKIDLIRYHVTSLIFS